MQQRHRGGLAAEPDRVATSAQSSAPSPSQPALTLERLLTADAPGLCGHEAGTLVDGVLPGVDRSQGIVELKAHVAMIDGTGRDPLTLVALNPDPHVGELAAVAAFTCDQGGVEWPDQLVGYDADLNILGAIDPAVETGGQRDLVWNLAWDDENKAATFDWSSQYPGEASCCGTMRLSGSSSTSKSPTGTASTSTTWTPPPGSYACACRSSSR